MGGGGCPSAAQMDRQPVVDEARVYICCITMLPATAAAAAAV